MPRTIESIVECHRAARDRRAEGKPSWAGEVRIKDLLTDKDDNESAAQVATEIAKRLRAGLKPELLEVMSDDYDDDIAGVVDDLEGFHAEMSEKVIELVNDRLDMLYDWADSNRIWIG